MTWSEYLRGWLPWPDRVATERDLSRLWDYVTIQTEATTHALIEMRKHMASTDEIASDLSALRDEVAGLDSAVAAKFEPLVSRLEGLGADPADPIPAPEPQPEPAPEPAPVDEPPPAA